MEFIRNFWEITTQMAPYLLLGFFLSGVVAIFINRQFIVNHLGKDSFGAVIKASLIGVPMPLCSCSVLPVAATLSDKGAKKGAVASFLASTPQTGVDSILITYSFLGGVYTLIRVVVAFVSGIITGAIVAMFKEVVGTETSGDSFKTEKKEKTDVVASMKYGMIDLPQMLAKELLLGLTVSALIITLTPANQFSELSTGGYFVMLAVGIPLYVCSSASVPIAASLLVSGFSPGAVLVFLISGPATNVASLTTMSRIIGRKETVTYVVSLIVVALVSGVGLDLVGGAKIIPGEIMTHAKGEGMLGSISAILLLSLLISSLKMSDFGLKTKKNT